jgi:hypothetical protein
MQKTRLLWSIAKRVLHGRARPDAIGALICLVTILAVMVFICVQWVRAVGTGWVEMDDPGAGREGLKKYVHPGS